MVPLIMLLAAYDSDGSENSIKLQESLVALHFNCLYLRSAMLPLLVPLVPCDANTSACVASHFVAPHFDYLD